jgi:hypothetical protein
VFEGGGAGVSELYAECPWGHRHRAVNVPDDPERWLDFICNIVSYLSPDEARRRAAAMKHPPAGQHFYVQTKDLKP